MKHLHAILFVLFAAFCSPAQVPMPNVAPRTNIAHSIAWDASPTPGVTYVLRRGIAPGKYDEMVNVSGLNYTWATAPAALTNYYVVTAKDANGWESDYSNELRVDPRQRPAAPNLKTAVPITVEIRRRAPGQEWASVLTLGPFYEPADQSAEELSAVVKVGKPIQLLPE
jgi:hypothetical protein